MTITEDGKGRRDGSKQVGDHNKSSPTPLDSKSMYAPPTGGAIEHKEAITCEESAVTLAGLHLIGVGPGNASLITHKAVRIAKECTHRFIEGYTSLMAKREEDELKMMVGDFKPLRRSEIEKPDYLLKLAKNVPVALLVVGDPLQATTHTDLLLRCEEEGVRWSVEHGISVTTLVTGGLGLQSYRFGRQVSIPFAYHGMIPTSPFELHAINHLLGLHTLVLLDLDPTGSGESAPRPMTPKEAVGFLFDMVKRLADDPPPHLLDDEGSLEEWNSPIDRFRREAVLARMGVEVKDWEAILCSDMGAAHQSLVHGTLSQIARLEGGTLNCIVLLGKMSDSENEAVRLLTESATDILG